MLNVRLEETYLSGQRIGLSQLTMFILFICYLCQVQGIGPTFKLTVNLQNTSLSQPSTSLLITFLYDEKLYNFKKSFIEVYISLI